MMEVALDAAVSPESIEFLNIGTVKWYELNICINWLPYLFLPQQFLYFTRLPSGYVLPQGHGSLG